MIEGEAINEKEANIEGEPPNASCEPQSFQLSLSTKNPNTDSSNDEFSKAQSVNVSSVFTTDEVSTCDLSSMYYLLS